jgi:biotin carboxyl carrier protein
MKYEVTVNSEQKYMIEVNQEGQVTMNGNVVEIDFSRIGDGGLHLMLVNNESFEGLVEEHEGVWQVLFRGDLYEVSVADERAQLMRARASLSVPETGELPIRAPMPGMVVAVPVTAGQQISKGENIVILESMKMENELKAPRDGTVEHVSVKVGDSVEQNQVLVVLG